MHPDIFQNNTVALISLYVGEAGVYQVSYKCNHYINLSLIFQIPPSKVKDSPALQLTLLRKHLLHLKDLIYSYNHNHTLTKKKKYDSRRLFEKL